MDTKIWLSVLLPAYNVQEWVQECVESLLNQGQEGVEILLLDDASTDASAQVLDKLRQDHGSRLRLLHHATNRGLSASRNSLLNEARGEYVWFIDSDDVVQAGALASLRARISIDAPDLILCDFQILRESSTLKHRLRGELHRCTFSGVAHQTLRDRSRLVEGLMDCGQLHVWSKIARKSVWQHASFPENRYFEDIAVLARLVEATKSFRYVPEAWIKYRQRQGSILADYTEGKIRDLGDNLANMHSNLLGLPGGLDSRARFSLDHFCLKSFASMARHLRKSRLTEVAGLRAGCIERFREIFPQGPNALLLQFLSRGWLLRAERAHRSLRAAGLVSGAFNTRRIDTMVDSKPGTAPNIADRPIRVLHFVTGGFSGGATQVAISLTRGALAAGDMQPLLVLRRKWNAGQDHIRRLQDDAVPLETVTRWPHLATIWSLFRICRKFRPDVLLAHGYSEHLWGRYAGLLAGVPHLVHIEHNSHERYSKLRRAQTRWLARRSSLIVGCSEGARQALLEMGNPPERTIAIANGIRLSPFSNAHSKPFQERIQGIVMVARFSRQKDHATLLHALKRLQDQGIRTPLILCGGGKRRRAMEELAEQLKLGDQVQFKGVCGNVPELLMQHQICVLSTHHEGMPLALLEGMAAGCAVIGSDVRGVRGLISDGENGRLVSAQDADALADAIAGLIRSPELAAQLGARARSTALALYNRERMVARYNEMVRSLAHGLPMNAGPPVGMLPVAE